MIGVSLYSQLEEGLIADAQSFEVGIMDEITLRIIAIRY